MLPAIAAVTERVRIGSLVAPTSVHHPAVLANRATTIDHLSNGRMVLGLGAGWQINEHKAYGIELEPPGRRVQRFEEAIQIIRALDDRGPHRRSTGDVYTITDATADPKPIQSPLPILVGTAGPRMLRIDRPSRRRVEHVGQPRHRDRAAGGVHRGVRRRRTRPGDDAHVGAGAGRHHRVGRSRSSVPGPVRSPTVRSPARSTQIVDAIGRYAELGFDEFIVPDFNLGLDTRATPGAARADRRRDRQPVSSS